MGNQIVESKQPTLAERAGDFVKTVNDLITDIESDLHAPGEAAFHAKDAYAALCRSHNALIDAAREQAAGRRTIIDQRYWTKSGICAVRVGGAA